MTDLTAYDPDSAERIGRATLFVESLRRNSPSGGNRSLPKSLGFWAKITGSDEGKHSWIGLKPEEDGSLVEDEFWGTGDHTELTGYAIEVNGSTVAEDTVVWLVPAIVQGFYLFQDRPFGLFCTTNGGSVESGYLPQSPFAHLDIGGIALLDTDTDEFTVKILKAGYYRVLSYAHFSNLSPITPGNQRQRCILGFEATGEQVGGADWLHTLIDVDDAVGSHSGRVELSGIFYFEVDDTIKLYALLPHAGATAAGQMAIELMSNQPFPS